MNRLVALVSVGTLLIACDGADGPVAPSVATKNDVVAGAGAAVYTGRGTAVDATVLNVNTKLCDTGPLQRSGGRIEHRQEGATIPGVVSASAVYCITTSGDNKAISEATVWQLNLTVGGNSITADHLHSMAGARCPPDVPPASSGSAFVTNLRVNGRAIVVPRNKANQRFDLPNGYAVFNEHRSFASPWHAGRTVTGLRVVINREGSTAEIVIARSLTHIDCP